MRVIALIVGESGVGKTTIVETLRTQYGLLPVESYTTRPRRFEGERGHTFITDDEFDKLADLVAYTEFDKFRYCATEDQINNTDLYVIDPYGVQEFTKRYRGDKTPIVIYLSANEDTRRCRMLERGDTLEAVEHRILHDRKAFSNNSVAFSGITTYTVMCNRELRYIVEDIMKIMSEQDNNINTKCAFYSNSEKCHKCAYGADDEGASYCKLNGNGKFKERIGSDV